MVKIYKQERCSTVQIYIINTHNRYRKRTLQTLEDIYNQTLLVGMDRYLYFSGLIIVLSLSFKIASRIFQFSQYLGRKLGMLFKIAQSVEVVIILGKTAILP